MVRVSDYFSYLESKKIRPYNNRRPNISIIQIKQNFLLLIIRQRTASNPSIHYNSRASGANNIYKNYSFWLWRFNWFNKLPYLLRQVKTRILTEPDRIKERNDKQFSVHLVLRSDASQLFSQKQLQMLTYLVGNFF